MVAGLLTILLQLTTALQGMLIIKNSDIDTYFNRGT